MKWRDLLPQIRTQLKDPNGARWSDEELRTYANYGLAHYSIYFPLETVETLPVSSGIISVQPSWEIISVEVDGYVLPEIVLRQGRKVHASTVGWYRKSRTQVVISGMEASAAQVRYAYPHPDLVDGDSDILIPSTDLEMIVLYVMWKATEKVGEASALADRFRKGTRDDNPMAIILNIYKQQYYEKLAALLASREIHIVLKPRRVR